MMGFHCAMTSGGSPPMTAKRNFESASGPGGTERAMTSYWSWLSLKERTMRSTTSFHSAVHMCQKRTGMRRAGSRPRAPWTANAHTPHTATNAASANSGGARRDRRRISGSIVDPPAVRAEDEPGDDHDDQKENPRHRARIPHVEVPPGSL